MKSHEYGSWQSFFFFLLHSPVAALSAYYSYLFWLQRMCAYVRACDAAFCKQLGAEIEA